MRHRSLISLSREHHHALVLSMKCRKRALGQAKPAPGETLQEFADEVSRFFTRVLERHFQAEEKVLFPFTAAACPESHHLIQELREEHDRIRRNVDGPKPASRLAKSLFDFADLLERHIRREERELFPIFERCVPEAEAEEVGQKIDEFLQPGEPAADRQKD